MHKITKVLAFPPKDDLFIIIIKIKFKNYYNSLKKKLII